MNNQNIFNEIREKIDIVDLIGEYIPLVQKGRNFFCVCPFHNDTNPSMSVSREKQIYKCFSCGASGNIFTFIKNYEQVEMGEALRILANKAGVSLGNVSVSRKNTKYDKYYEAYQLANKFYQNNLNTKEGLEAKNYLKQRGFDDGIIKEFELGLSLDTNNNLTELLKQKQYDLVTLEKTGLTSNNHDIFINRIMVPLHDINGKVVGFSGRIYNKKSDSKYINTKETEVFKKGYNLYNYHRAKEEARRNKYIIIVEGYMDVFRLSTIGYNNVVALMGTALTIEQANLIKKASLNVILCLDGDNPGTKAMLTIGEELEKISIKTKVVRFSNNDDPDTFIINSGKKEFDLLIENAILYSDFKLNSLKLGVNFSSDIELSKYIDTVVKEASSISDEIRREIILKKLANDTNIGYNTLEKRLHNYINKKSETKVISTPKKIKTSKYEKAVYGLIYGMLTSEDVLKKVISESIYFTDKTVRYLIAEIEYYYHKFGNANIADFYTYLLEKEEILELYNKIIAYSDNDIITTAAINDYISVIKDYNMRQEIKRLNEVMKKEISDTEKSKIAEEIRLLRIGE